jgi:hypothetical protein
MAGTLGVSVLVEPLVLLDKPLKKSLQISLALT